MRQILMCGLMLVSLNACALTVDEITLNYSSAVPQTTLPNASAITVQVTGSEGRSANLERVSVKKNGYGMEMAAIVTKQNLPDLVKSALEQELTKQGFHIGSNSMLVNVELIKFYNDFKVGVFSGDAVAEVTVNAQVKTEDGRIFYARSVTGNGKEANIQLAMGHNAKAALDKALAACIEKLIADTEFTKAIFTASGGRRMAGT